ncbi:hypothetical protein [Actinophytocola algeriensis]|uniref:Uncharacterized protein n=1 Tax=Actinophytocola algeriensis TaxID=1768010 RepID=A0A7W7Q785_9PSEU|nr:hypothetical protein [Actinophytocola algeriensis]MBB4908335.1 hypothetical protein [Actinophytocola algeriensis]MBE1480365.1 hypothetical protein [Actinophytocola algeriensis]
MAEFDVKRVSTLEWAGIGAGLAAFIFSFLPWYSVDVAGFGGGSLSAWSTGFFALMSVLLLMAAGGLVLAPHFGVQVARLPLIWLSLSGVAILFILLQWLILPDDGGIGDFSLLGGSGIESGAGFGLILGLIAALTSAGGALMAFRGAPKPAPGANPAAA